MQLARHGHVAALRNRLRAPRDALAAGQDAPHARVRLQLLEQVVRRQLGVAVVEPDDEPDRDHVVAHRVDERAAELAELAAAAERPAHRVDDAARAAARTRQTSFTPSAQTCGCSPCRPKWSSATPVRWPCVPSHSTVTRATTSEPGLEVRQLLPVPAAALVAGAHADHAAAGDEQLDRGRLREDRGAALLGALGQPAAELRERGDVVAVVPHRRRRRQPRGAVPGQEEHRLVVHLPVEGHVLDGEPPAEEAPQAARVDDGAGEEVRARAPCPSPARRPARPRAARRRPGSPRAAGRAGSRTRARPARRRRRGCRPRSARPRDRWARRPPPRSARAAGSRPAGLRDGAAEPRPTPCAASRARSASARPGARRPRRRGRRTRRSARSGPC